MVQVNGSRVDSRIEDLTNYTVVDPNTDFTIDATSIVIDGCNGTVDAWIVYDLGADKSGWIGDYRAEFDITPSLSCVGVSYLQVSFALTSSSTSCTYDNLAGRASEVIFHYAADPSYLGGQLNSRNVRMPGTSYSSLASYYMTRGTTYYVRVERRGCRARHLIFSDAARTTVFWSGGWTNCSTIDGMGRQMPFRYIVIAGSGNLGFTQDYYGKYENYKIWLNNSRISLGLNELRGTACRLTTVGNRKMRQIAAGLRHIK